MSCIIQLNLICWLFIHFFKSIQTPAEAAKAAAETAEAGTIEAGRLSRVLEAKAKAGRLRREERREREDRDCKIQAEHDKVI